VECWDFIHFVSWFLWDIWWLGARKNILIFPKDALSTLVDGTRARLTLEGIDNVKVTTGDILAAWLLKVNP
jgi:hypothetical protein